MTAGHWGAARAAMLLDPTAVNLNSGSGGPLPWEVHRTVADLRERLAEAPMDFLLREVPALLGTARERLAGFLGGDPTRLIFTANVTAAVNLLATGLPLEAPGEILLTDHEYQPMRWCWERAAERRGLRLRVLRLPRDPAGPEELVAAAAAAIGPDTRLFFFSHVLSATGTVMPVRRLCELAREHGVTTVVDGAHGPGFTEVDVAATGCDFYVGGGHKWLLAPTGTGFLHFAPGRADALEPAQVSWGYRGAAGVRSPDLPVRGSTARLRRFEVEGTRDICPWLALPAAIDFQAGLGPERIRARMRELAASVRERLADACGLEPVTPRHPELSGGLASFALPPGTDADRLRAQLWQDFRIEVAVAEQRDRSLLRVSTHFFNTEDEVDHLVGALSSMFTASLTRESRRA